MVAINLIGPFLVTRALLPLLKGRGWGRIVCIGSASVFKGVPGQVHYVAAKAGVLGFARSLAREVGRHGQRRHAGADEHAPAKRSMPAAMIADSVKSRAIQREEVAGDLVGAVVFLASPDRLHLRPDDQRRCFFATARWRTPVTGIVGLILMLGHYAPFWIGEPFLRALSAPSLPASVVHIEMAKLASAALAVAFPLFRSGPESRP